MLVVPEAEAYRQCQPLKGSYVIFPRFGALLPNGQRPRYLACMCTTEVEPKEMYKVLNGRGWKRKAKHKGTGHIIWVREIYLPKRGGV